MAFLDLRKKGEFEGGPRVAASLWIDPAILSTSLSLLPPRGSRIALVSGACDDGRATAGTAAHLLESRGWPVGTCFLAILGDTAQWVDLPRSIDDVASKDENHTAGVTQSHGHAVVALSGDGASDLYV
jgi:hypothetical protein